MKTYPLSDFYGRPIGKIELSEETVNLIERDLPGIELNYSCVRNGMDTSSHLLGFALLFDLAVEKD